jgi:N-acetyl-alpha-D-muramate 1-phosphate uridylyltransferase
MQAVILAGGLATRMRPLTLNTPKVLLPVNGRAFLDWQLLRLRSFGFDDIVLCVAYLGEQVEAYAGNGDRFGVRIRYAHEGEVLLGTAGALKKAESFLDETFLVTYGDSYLPFDYASPLTTLRASQDADGVMSIFHNASKFDASNVRCDPRGDWVLAYEKGTKDPAFDHIDYGALALRRSVLASIPEGICGLELVQARLAREHRMRAVVAKQRFFEVGSMNGLADLEAYLYDQKS